MKPSNVLSFLKKLVSTAPAPEPAESKKVEPRELAYSSSPSGPRIPRPGRGNDRTV